MSRSDRHNFRSRGFTLMELLMVILIILLLIGILIPVLSHAKRIANNSATQSVFQTIGNGLGNYYADFNMYPPSRPATDSSNATIGIDGHVFGSSTSINRGSVMLAQGLNGFLGYDLDGGGPVLAGGGASPFPSDPAYCFRDRQSALGGTVHGPYVTPDPKLLKTVSSTDQYFIDVWGNEILYYRAVPSKIKGRSRGITSIFGTWTSTAFPNADFDSVFIKQDNAAAIDPWSITPGPPQVIADPTVAGNSADRPFWVALGSSGGTNNLGAGDKVAARDNYILISSGQNGRFFTADDIVSVRK